MKFLIYLSLVASFLSLAVATFTLSTKVEQFHVPQAAGKVCGYRFTPQLVGNALTCYRELPNESL